MAVTGKDKVFVVNENTNTKYGGVDPSGSFKTIDELRGYKVYTALLTQSGGSDPQSQSSGAVEQGVTYQISSTRPPNPWDFSNVGGPKFPENWSFVATSNDVPNEYGNATLNYDTGAPVATVLENTIGNIWFTYDEVGSYFINSNNLFIYNKTYLYSQAFLYGPNEDRRIGMSSSDSTSIQIITTSGTIMENDNLYNTSIEIRVYN